MTNQFNPAVPAIPLGSEGCCLAVIQGCPAFAGGVVVAYNSGTPVGIPSSGSFANNGALSGLTAFATTYPFVYLFFPAGAIFAGSAAGFYYTQMTGTATGVVFNNMLLSGMVPKKIVNPTPLIVTGPGAYTQSNATQTMVEVDLLGGCIKNNGGIELYNTFSLQSSGDNKRSAILIDGSQIQQFAEGGSSSFQNTIWVHNTGQVDRQIAPSVFVAGSGPSGASNTFLTVNTSNEFTIDVTASLDSSADWIVLEAMTIRLINT